MSFLILYLVAVRTMPDNSILREDRFILLHCLTYRGVRMVGHEAAGHIASAVRTQRWVLVLNHVLLFIQSSNPAYSG